MFAYFTPLLGAFIADSYLGKLINLFLINLILNLLLIIGKYLTILYLSIVYVAGNILISYASYLQNE